jgi:hypothetical protein
MFDDVESLMSTISKTADVSLGTERVVCLAPSIYSATLVMSPAVKPLPARVTCAVFVAESKPGVRVATVAFGSSKLNSQGFTS